MSVSDNAPLLVACVGDSITYGYRGGSRRSPKAYPTVLQGLLGSRYHVTNLGNSGKTASKEGRDGGDPGFPASYWSTKEFAALNASRWDVVVHTVTVAPCNVTVGART